MQSEQIYTLGGSPCHPEVADQCQVVRRKDGGEVVSSKIIALKPKRASSAEDFFLRTRREDEEARSKGSCFDRWAETYEVLFRTQRQYDRATAKEELQELAGEQKRAARGRGVPFVALSDLSYEEQTEERRAKLHKLQQLAKEQEWQTPKEAEEAKVRRKKGESWGELRLS